METPKPVHKSFQDVSVDLTFSSLVEMTGALAYQDFQNVGASLTFSSLKQSGYQYILGTVIQEESQEASGSLDQAIKIIRKTAHEFHGSVDLADTRPAKGSESSGSLDSATRVVRKTANEFHGSVDAATAFSPHPVGEGAGSVDTAMRIVRKTAHEFMGSDDSASFSLAQRQTFSTRISGKVVEEFYFSSVAKLRALNSSNYSTNVIGQIENLVAATATGGSNPFDPSVAIGGNTIIGPTAPPAAQTVYISIPNTGISTIPDWGNLRQYGVSLDYGGGSFSVSSSITLGALGQQIQIFGLNAVITEGGTNGKEYSSSHKGFVASGIFGAPKLNRQINLAVAGSIIAAPIVLNPSLISAPANTWLTAKTIASLIANICGVSLLWAAGDVSVKDFSLEPGMKGIDVLQSMAQRVGATLRWFGNNKYYVAYPPKTVGQFIVPNQNLITQSGISMQPLLDLETGIAGGVSQGVYSIPTISTTSSTLNGVATAPNPSVGPNNPTVTQVAKVSKLLTDEDPAMIFDLPFNYDQVYIQILIAPGQSTSGANGLGIQNFVTANPQQVFLFSDVGFASSYIFNTLVGNATIPQIKIDSRLLPDNDAVQAGNFTLTVFCTLKSLSDAYDAAKDDADNNGSGVQLRNPQFVKTHVGKINCYFYGVMPLPGMYGQATVDDLTVSGVIEHVTFTPPGILSLDIARYTAINYTQPYINIGAE